MKRWMWAFAVLVVTAGCGQGGVPTIAGPGEGEKIALDQRPCFDVTLADNDYQSTTIEVKGAEQFRGELTCRPGNYAPASCCRTATTGSTGFYGNTCVEGSPCILVFIARRGDRTDVRTVQVVRYTQATAAY